MLYMRVFRNKMKVGALCVGWIYKWGLYLLIGFGCLCVLLLELDYILGSGCAVSCLLVHVCVLEYTCLVWRAIPYILLAAINVWKCTACRKCG